jgi:hypothetical protein
MSPQPDEVFARLNRLTATDQFALVPLSGGASDRWYFRVTGPLAERYGRPFVVLMGIAPELNGMFDSYLRVRSCLARHDIPVPALHDVWMNDGMILLEDFGDLTVMHAAKVLPGHRAALYDCAIQLLAQVHQCPEDRGEPCPAFSLHFDVEKFQYEFDFHVRRWVIGHWCGFKPTSAEERTLTRAFDWISTTLAAEPRVFTHRDFQTSNLMVRNNPEHDAPQLGLIDFQDARQGLRQYDLASLLFDSYVEVTPAEREQLADLYGRRADVRITERFHRLLTVAAIQRKLHDAGAFIYAAAQRGKTEYLGHVPATLRLAIGLMMTVPRCREAGEVLADYLERRSKP